MKLFGQHENIKMLKFFVIFYYPVATGFLTVVTGTYWISFWKKKNLNYLKSKIITVNAHNENLNREVIYTGMKAKPWGQIRYQGLSVMKCIKNSHVLSKNL